MISVITLTYQRHHLLEEAMQSFLEQDYKGEIEMVIVNDSDKVEYRYEHPQIRIYNIKERFSSIGKKLEWGMKQCKGQFVYRLDDDDLMTPWALSLVNEYKNENPDYDVYRCQHHYFFSNNKYEGLSDSINNGNTYTKSYINRIDFPDKSGDEDNTITFHRGAKIYTGDTGRYSMIYRWGMQTTHISGIGSVENDIVYNQVDKYAKEEGIIDLHPHFRNDYYTPLENIQ
jgi:cellulose synthase/poly-beta-1,6-N-acetylglucosamine synthase-like glycosyltransferase